MIKELTSLRYILILVIFFHHALPSYPGGGDMGVACFFVLSGFCYALGYGSKVTSAQFNYRSFVKSRLVKFYPLHWITLLLAIPISIYAALGWKNILVLGANAILVQSWIPISTVYYSYNGVSWFLSDMVFLVMAFPFLFRWLDSRNKRTICLVMAGIAYCFICIVTPGPHRNTVLYVHPIVRLCDFMVGILAGMWYLHLSVNKPVDDFVQHHKAFTAMVSWLSMLILVALSVFVPAQYTLMAWIFWPAIVILLLSVSLNRGGLLANPFLHRLGTISFPFYMIHQLVIRYLDLASGKADIHVPLAATVTISLLLSILLSFLLDKTVLRRLKRIGASETPSEMARRATKRME